MKIRILFSIYLLGLMSQNSIAQSIPFSFYQIPNYGQTEELVYTAAINPALLGSVKKLSAGIYAEVPYGLRDIMRTSGSIGIPISNGAFGAHLLHIGNSSFSESAFLLQYAKQLSMQKNYAGISFGITQKKDVGYAVLRQYQAAFGLHLSFSEDIHYGIVMQVRQMQEREGVDIVVLDYQLGMGYRFTPQFSGSIQINKEAKRGPFFYVKAGYQIHKSVLVNMVCSTGTQELWAQAIFHMKNMDLGFSVGFHHIMGVTPGTMIMTK
jgi:hypothetical protein